MKERHNKLKGLTRKETRDLRQLLKTTANKLTKQDLDRFWKLHDRWIAAIAADILAHVR